MNWILNQEFVGMELTGEGDGDEGVILGTATYGDVQYAIWDLVNMDRVNEIVRRATHHAGFIPE